MNAPGPTRGKVGTALVPAPSDRVGDPGHENRGVHSPMFVFFRLARWLGGISHGRHLRSVTGLCPFGAGQRGIATLTGGMKGVWSMVLARPLGLAQFGGTPWFARTPAATGWCSTRASGARGRRSRGWGRARSGAQNRGRFGVIVSCTRPQGVADDPGTSSCHVA